MNEYTYDYYVVHIPADAGDTDERLRLAIDQAREQARLYALPCEWAADILDDERVRVRRRRLRPTFRRHYHVVQGMQGGYLPDLNWPMRTRRQAERTAAELAREWREEWDEDDAGRWRPVYRVEGSARQGRYTIERREPSEAEYYIEITTCDQDECWKEIEQ